MEFRVVIPARYASTRLPGKPLLDIAGKPMIQRVVERACASARGRGAGRDGRRAHRRGRARSATPACAHRGSHRSGARVRYRSGRRGGGSSAAGRIPPIVVNVQGDEPFLPPELIDQVAAALAADASASIATLATPVKTLGRIHGSERRQGGYRPSGPRALFQPRPRPVGTRTGSGRRGTGHRRSDAPHRDSMRTGSVRFAGWSRSRRRRSSSRRSSSSCAPCRTA